MPASTDNTAWERLGQMLTRRRVELDPRYARSLQVFADERGINYRLAWDIEGAKRTNYTRASLALVEVAYALEHGSLDDALAGGSFRLSELPRRHGQRAAGPSDADVQQAVEAAADLREKMTRAGFTAEQQQALLSAPAAFRILMERKRARDRNGEAAGESA